MFKRLFILLFLPLVCAAYDLPVRQSLAAPLEVWLCVGQSNMVGTSSGDTSIYTTSKNDSLLPIWKRAGTDPVALTVGVDTLAGAASDGRGAEYGFLRMLHSRGHYRAVVLKHATNGKGLWNWWLPGNSGYTNLLASIEQFEADIAPQVVRYRGIFWIQGTNDSNQSQSTAEAYGANLAVLLAQLRSDLATPDLIFISPEHPAEWSTGTHASIVRSEVVSYCASDPRAVTFSSAGTTTRDAGTHYEDGDGSFELLGVRAAEAFFSNY